MGAGIYDDIEIGVCIDIMARGELVRPNGRSRPFSTPMTHNGL